MNAVQIIIKHLKETGKISDIVLWSALNESYEHHTKVSSWYWVKHGNCKDIVTYSLDGRPKMSWSKFKKCLQEESEHWLTEDFRRYCDEVLFETISSFLVKHDLLKTDIDSLSSDDLRIAIGASAWKVTEW